MGLDPKTALGPFAVELYGEPHACAYIEGRTVTDELYVARSIQPESYHELMNMNFRRSGVFIYRPRCVGCTMCKAIRIPAGEFRPSRSQRRALRRNRDVRMIVRKPEVSAEKAGIYRRYLAGQHRDTTQENSLEALHGYLYDSCVETEEIEYRDAGGRLLGVSIVDVCRESISAVYHYFDPCEARRSLGTYSAVREIELCRERGIPWFYMGYWIKGCKTMDYKANFRPHEILEDGRWIRPEDSV